MVKLGVITLVDKPTDWVSSVAYTWKVSGDLYICLDPPDLNNAICRDHHHAPTVDEVAHELAHSKYFKKLDARHGYCAVILDCKSSLLTIFKTPYGQYHFLHLPFGLACCQDVFQKWMAQILEECEGCIGIANFITIHCHTEAEHDCHSWKLMKVAQQYGLLFNPKKTQVRTPMVKLFWCLYDESGVHPDPEKVDAVHALPTATNITEHEFLGMVTYLSPFIPGLFTLTAPLHELCKKDAEFSLNASYQTVFPHVKDAVVIDTTLWYLDASCPITVQVDASQVWLGAALLQDNKPVAFTSKALTEVEHCYAKIESEMLAIVIRAEHFRIMSMVDPSPLNLTISHWNHSLRRAFLIHLPSCHACSYACKGMIMFFTTALVRKWPTQIHSHVSSPNLALRLHWILSSTMLTCPLSKRKPSNWPLRWMLRCVPWMISSSLAGPFYIKEVLHPLHPYWQHHESLTVEDGLVLYGEDLIIPPSEKEKVLGTLHQPHQGITKT